MDIGIFRSQPNSSLQYNFFLGDVTKYSSENAVEELHELERKMVPFIEKYLESNQTMEVAKALVIVNKELYRIEEEARRLRLTGELDPEIYRTLTRGYRGLAYKIMNLAQDYKIAHEVSVLQKALKFSSETAGTYLQEYVEGLG